MPTAELSKKGQRRLDCHDGWGNTKKLHEVGVPRNPRLVPILTMSPHHTSHPNMAAVQQEQQEQMLQEQELASTAQAMEGANPTNQSQAPALLVTAIVPT
eukprot:1141707-Pelagomonas_calceolata.AAC.2